MNQKGSLGTKSMGNDHVEYFEPKRFFGDQIHGNDHVEYFEPKRFFGDQIHGEQPWGIP